MLNKKNIYVTLIVTTLLVFMLCGAGIIKAPDVTTAIPLSAAPATEPPPTEPLIETPVLFTDFTYKAFYDIELSNNYLNKLYRAAQTLDLATTSGDYTIAAVAAMLAESTRIHDLILDIKLDIENYTTWEQEHYYAAKVYEFLRKNNYSAEVACAIIGNMMIECGGFTLDLQPNAYNAAEHGGGLCGWLYQYYPEANGATFEQQCEILLNTIEYQFDVFSFCYYKGFSYEAFLSMTSVEDAALAFAKVYERCASFGYDARKTAAKTAYNYFVGEE